MSMYNIPNSENIQKCTTFIAAYHHNKRHTTDLITYVIFLHPLQLEAWEWELVQNLTQMRVEYCFACVSLLLWCPLCLLRYWLAV